MNRKIKLSLLLLSFMFVFYSISAVSGAIVEEVIVFHEMDVDGLPVERLAYSPADDVVMVWANLTDVHADDTVTFSFWEPLGNLYYSEDVVLPSYVDGSSWYSVMSEIEVQGEPAEDMLGTWTVSVFNEDSEGAVELFEIADTGAESTGSGSEEKIRGYYIWVDDVRPVGEVVIGENVTVEIVVKYSFPIKSPLVPSIFDDGFELRGDTSDEIQGSGETTYTVTMATVEGDESRVFYAVAYYFIDGNWTFMDPDGYKAFTLSGDSGGSVVPDGVKIPDGLDLSNIDVDQITSALNETYQKGLDFLENIEVPEEIFDLEEKIKEQTGIPGYPLESILLAAALALALRKRK
ncbi:hypothetical protein MUP51_08605 [Candidatus Bathyarchaeota archaeon]|nr:hypothetical protein [Candidatus Bathyarchaeota archaeon]